MTRKRFSKWTLLIGVAAILTVATTLRQSVAQDLPIDPGPVVPDVEVPTDNLGGGGATGQIGNLGDGIVDPNNVEINISDDVRNQGFIGATAPGIQEQGYVGAASDLSGPPLAEGATFGGGINGSSTSGVGGGGRNLGNVQGGFGVQGAQNGFEVTRRGLRTRLRPEIFATPISAGEVSQRFNQRLIRLPVTNRIGGQFQIIVENRTATVVGTVDSQESANSIVRQLRLEPGVDSINNRLNVSN